MLLSSSHNQGDSENRLISFGISRIVMIQEPINRAYNNYNIIFVVVQMFLLNFFKPVQF